MKKVIIISGPTASGKTKLAEYVHDKLVEYSVIINADSMQVYKELPILSAQPQIHSHHLLYGYKDYYDKYSAGVWLDDVKKYLNNMLNIPIIVGGSGLYIKSLIFGLAEIPNIPGEIRQEINKKFTQLGKKDFYLYLKKVDPSSQKFIKPTDKQRMLRAAEVFVFTGKSIVEYWENSHPVSNNYQFLHLSLTPERSWLYQNCDNRFETMLKEGGLDEVRLLKEKIDVVERDFQITITLGYKQLAAYLNNNLSFEEAKKEAQQKTRNYAKRQLTWFRNQKEAINIDYDFYSAQLEEKCLNMIYDFLT